MQNSVHPNHWPVKQFKPYRSLPQIPWLRHLVFPQLTNGLSKSRRLALICLGFLDYSTRWYLSFFSFCARSILPVLSKVPVETLILNTVYSFYVQDASADVFWLFGLVQSATLRHHGNRKVRNLRVVPVHAGIDSKNHVIFHRAVADA